MINVTIFHRVLASVHCSQDLVHKILPPHLHSTDLLDKNTAISVWSKGHHQSPSQDKASYFRRHGTLDQASDVITRARLLAVSRKESLAWLHAVPNSSLGLRMDNETIRVAVGLRLYADHTLASIVVDCFALHGLSCHFSTGRRYRHPPSPLHFPHPFKTRTHWPRPL